MNEILRASAIAIAEGVEALPLPVCEALELTADERKLGIVAMMCVAWKRSTAVLIETESGIQTAGHTVTPPGRDASPVVGRMVARNKAIRELLYMRGFAADDASGGRPRGPGYVARE
jgi:hypothetical protein